MTARDSQEESCSAGGDENSQNDSDGPPWFVKYRVYEKRDEACASREGGHTGEQETWTGVFNEPTKIDCINAIVYELRGVRSRWELAYVDEIKPAAEADR